MQECVDQDDQAGERGLVVTADLEHVSLLALRVNRLLLLNSHSCDLAWCRTTSWGHARLSLGTLAVVR